jgi:threonyl-tRNA synthetase
VKAFAATRFSATNWLGDTENDSLQRMYGISFPDKKMLKVWKENQEKAKERDHRRIAQKQDLIMFHDLSAGSGEATLMDAMAGTGLDQETVSEKTLLWDMMRPPVSKLKFLKFENDKEAKTVFWHSAAYMMGEALENLYGCKLTIHCWISSLLREKSLPLLSMRQLLPSQVSRMFPAALTRSSLQTD